MMISSNNILIGLLFYTIIVPGVVDINETINALIAWTPPSQPNGIIIGYQVIYSVYEIASTEVTSAMISTYSELFPLYLYNIQGLSKLMNN